MRIYNKISIRRNYRKPSLISATLKYHQFITFNHKIDLINNTDSPDIKKLLEEKSEHKLYGIHFDSIKLIKNNIPFKQQFDNIKDDADDIWVSAHGNQLQFKSYLNKQQNIDYKRRHRAIHQPHSKSYSPKTKYLQTYNYTENEYYGPILSEPNRSQIYYYTGMLHTCMPTQSLLHNISPDYYSYSYMMKKANDVYHYSKHSHHAVRVQFNNCHLFLKTYFPTCKFLIKPNYLNLTESIYDQNDVESSISWLIYDEQKNVQVDFLPQLVL